MDRAAYNAQMEAALLREAALQFVSTLRETLLLMQAEQQGLLLGLSYDETERRGLCCLLAHNLAQSGFPPYTSQEIQESVGEVLLEKLIYLLMYGTKSGKLPVFEAIALLEHAKEYQAYVRDHPPAVTAPRRDRVRDSGPEYATGDMEATMPEVPATDRHVYQRAVRVRRARGDTGRTRWHLRVPVPE